MQEQYLQHPHFGLLYAISAIGTSKGLFTTLYAQRMFFLVTELEDNSLQFETLGRQQVRQVIEGRLRALRQGEPVVVPEEHDRLKTYYHQNFG